MTILLITKEEGCGVAGVGMYNERFKKYLKNKGHKIFEIRFTNNSVADKTVFTIPFHYSHSKTMILVPSAKTFELINRYLTKLKPNVVYMGIGISPFDYLIPDICHKHGIPIGAAWHGDYRTGSRIYSTINKIPFYALTPYCKKLDMLHVFSSQIKRFYIKRGVEAEKIKIIPNGVDPNVYQPGMRGSNDVLYLGRITKVKNPELLIKAFLKIDPLSNLIFVGTGELEEKLKEKYADPRIKFLGLITDEKEKVKIFQSCRIFVLPSNFEGMSLSMLEAMGCGLACVSTDIGTHKEVLKNAGVVISLPKVKKQLPLQLKKLLDNPKLSSKLGKLARQKVLDIYNQEKIFAQLEKSLCDLPATRRTAAAT